MCPRLHSSPALLRMVNGKETRGKGEEKKSNNADLFLLLLRFPIHASYASIPTPKNKDDQHLNLTLIAKDEKDLAPKGRSFWACNGCLRKDQNPVVVGGFSQCRSICSKASFHSQAKQAASCWASSASGTQPPHISGFAASAVA